jgi:hypothetical protein
VPLVCYPRLQNTTPKQQERWTEQLCGYGIYWEELEEDFEYSREAAGCGCARR